MHYFGTNTDDKTNIRGNSGKIIFVIAGRRRRGKVKQQPKIKIDRLPKEKRVRL